MDVLRSPVVLSVKLLTSPKKAISKRIFICFGRFISVNAVAELTIISTEKVAFAECTRKVVPFVHGSMIDVTDMRLTPSSDRTYILADRI